MYAHAVQCVHDAIEAVQEQNPKYGSARQWYTRAARLAILSASAHRCFFLLVCLRVVFPLCSSVASAMAALRSPTSATTGVGLGLGLSSLDRNDLTLGALDDSSHTVSGIGRRDSRARALALPGGVLLPAHFSATVGQLSAPRAQLAAHLFDPEPAVGPPDSLQRFFAEELTSSQSSSSGETPSERFAARFAFVLLRLSQHLTQAGVSTPLLSNMLPAVLRSVDWLEHRKTLHLPAAERLFDDGSSTLRELLNPACASSSSSGIVPVADLPLTRLSSKVRLDLAGAQLAVWLSREEALPGALSSSASTPVPSPTLAPAAAATAGVTPTDTLGSVEELLLQAARDPAQWDAAPPSRSDALLLSGLVGVVSHSRARMHMDPAAMVAFDRTVVTPPRGPGHFLFGASAYTPQPVREFAALVDAPSHLALLRQAWGLLRIASDTARQLVDMFGADSVPPAVLTVTNAISPGKGATKAPLSPARAGLPEPPGAPTPFYANPRVRVARRQARQQLRQGLLLEFDACAALFEKDRLARHPTATALDAKNQSPIAPTAMVKRIIAVVKSEIIRQTERDR